MSFFSKLSWPGKAGLALIGLAIIAFIAAYFLGAFRPGEEAEARAKLQLALDSWKDQVGSEKFQKANPNIGFSESPLMHKRLLRYEIVSAQTAAKGGTEFSVKLTFLLDGKEREEPFIYHVYQGKVTKDREGWNILVIK